MHYTTRVTNRGDSLFSGALNRVHCKEYEPIQCRAAVPTCQREQVETRECAARHSLPTGNWQ